MKTAFVFPGQGAQFVGMGRELAANYKEADEIFKRANEVLGLDIEKLSFEGPEEELRKTEITQPSILTVSIAALKVLEKQGIFPDIVAGLSLGEYSALVSADVISFEDALSLVQKRGRFMQEAAPEGQGTMAAIIGLNKSNINKICKRGVVEVANFNCPNQIVIAGEVNAVKQAMIKAKELGARSAIELNVSAPFHTSLLKPAGEKLFFELNRISFNVPKVPFISNVTGNYVSDPKEIKTYLKRQVSSPVLWEDTIRRMIRDGVKLFIEVGLGKTLSSFIKKIDKKSTVVHIEDPDTLEKAKHVYREVATCSNYLEELH